MLRRLALASLPAALLIGACTHANVMVAAPPPPAPAEAASPQPVPKISGMALVAQPYLDYVFAPREVILGEVVAPPTAVTLATLRVMADIHQRPRLKAIALASTDDTVALALQEFSTERQKWGSVMVPIERRLFGQFAKDPSLGDWLIVVDDVDVTDGADPIPPTAYRWSRAAVVAYASCGIPPTFVIDGCTDRFYEAAQVSLLISQARSNSGQ